MKRYNKLVRDKIPEIIAATGQRCKTRVLDREEYLVKLEEKLREELAEYQQSQSMEELADLLEVMAAVVDAKGCTWQELVEIQEQKRAKRGGFSQRILLESVTEGDHE